jgi:hypothetical protein
MPFPRLRAARLVPACLGLSLLYATLASPGAHASAPARDAGVAKRTVAEVEAYWTAQRMEAAQPLDVTLGSPGDAPRAAQPASPSTSTVPFTSFELTDTSSFPDRVHGKVFFTRPGVGNFVCSGTVVDAQNRATVITAGHCVHDGGQWSTNFAFAPGYREVAGFANAPYGLWGASDEAAPEPWVDSENVKFDVGAAVLANDTLGRQIENVVGARAIAFNQPTGQAFRSHGYPAEPSAQHSFDGMRLWACDSASSITDDPTSASGPATIGIGCDMTGGSSGGGWVNGGYLEGVNSYKYDSQPNLMYGPYFGATIQALYDFVSPRPPGAIGNQAAGNGVPDASDPAPSTASPSPCSKPKKPKRAKKAKKRKRRRRSAKRACKSKRV